MTPNGGLQTDDYVFFGAHYFGKLWNMATQERLEVGIAAGAVVCGYIKKCANAPTGITDTPKRGIIATCDACHAHATGRAREVVHERRDTAAVHQVEPRAAGASGGDDADSFAFCAQSLSTRAGELANRAKRLDAERCRCSRAGGIHAPTCPASQANKAADAIDRDFATEIAQVNEERAFHEAVSIATETCYSFKISDSDAARFVAAMIPTLRRYGVTGL